MGIGPTVPQLLTSTNGWGFGLVGTKVWLATIVFGRIAESLVWTNVPKSGLRGLSEPRFEASSHSRVWRRGLLQFVPQRPKP